MLTINASNINFTSGLNLRNGADDWYIYQNVRITPFSDDGFLRLYIDDVGDLYLGGKANIEGNATIDSKASIGTGINSSYALEVESDTTTSGGLYVDNNYRGSSTNYGIRSSLDAFGTGIKYGIYSNVFTNSSSSKGGYGIYTSVLGLGSGNVYGGYLVSSGGTGTSYGLYSSGRDWSGYFTGTGDVYVANELLVGTTNGAAGYSVSVDGKIMCEELRVELSSSWPDYVFEDDYDKMSLKDVIGEFIQANKHLLAYLLPK